MPEYIDRDYVRKFATYTHRKSGVEPIKVVPLKFIKDAPAADVEPVRHGKWTKVESAYWRYKHDGAHCVSRIKYKHNECGKVVDKKVNYCPNCGAKMDEEVET